MNSAFFNIMTFFREKTWVKVALIFFITFLCYVYVLQCGYIWDDDYLVFNNPFLHTPHGLQQLWFNFKSRTQYYPVVFTVFWVFYQLWGTSPVGYHLANILIHSFNAVLVWFVLRRLNVKGAFWAGLVFAVHPVHVESVAWVSELKNTLSGCFFLSSLGLYLRLYTDQWRIHFRPWIYTGALLLYLLALFSKTITCVLPVIFLLLLWWKKDRIRAKDILLTSPFFVFGLCMGLLTVWMEIHQVGAFGSEWQHSFMERILIAGRALWFYLGKLILPINLIFTYPRWHIDASLWWQYLYPIGFLGFLLSAWRASLRWGKGVIVALIYFLIVLFPALGFFNLYPMRFSYVADHFQYLASIGPIAFVVACLALLWERSSLHWKRNLSIVFGAVLCCFCVLSWKQTFIYKDLVAVFNDVIKKNPESWMAYNNRGNAFFQVGKVSLAEPDFRQALKLNPEYTDALNNMGLVAYIKGDLEGALEYFSQVIELNEKYFPAYGNRGLVYRDLKEFDKAEENFDKAIEINPFYISGYNRRAVLYSILKKDREALQDYNTLLKIDPRFVVGYLNRAIILMRGNNYRSALQDLNRALILNPRMAKAYLTRADVFEYLGKWDLAMRDLNHAYQLGADVDPEAVARLRSKLGEKE